MTKPKIQKFQTPKGMHDILPEEQKFWAHVKKVVRYRAREAGFKRITTPILEDVGLISRSVGESSDIVKKEMFTLERSSQTLVLRPENTAGVVRAYIEHGMASLPQPIQLYYIEPMFRAEQPQKGRYRQFYQYGLEVIGERDPALDAQIIHSAYMILKDCGLAEDLVAQINSLGDPEDRKKYIMALQEYFAGKERALTDISRERLISNPLRILDTKDEDERILLQLAPKLHDFISEDALIYHQTLKEYLDELEVPYVENDMLVRGLDYYNRTVFEFTRRDDPSFAYCGGGRYDGLIEMLGGVPTPAIGFAAGMERIIAAMKEKNFQIEDKDAIQVFVAQIGSRAKKKSLSLLARIRAIGIKAMGSMGKSSISSQLKYADKFQAPWCILLGDTEVIDGTVIIKHMASGNQVTIPYENIIDEMIARIGKENILHYRIDEELQD